MQYLLDFSEKAREELRALSKEQRRRIGQKLDAIQTDLQGDVKSLRGRWANIVCESERTGYFSRSKKT
jgi:mRNA-degrading endonuclease RelE of RelBE toxin-antitoxin system